MPTLTQARLKEVLQYNPNTGDFIWIKHRLNTYKNRHAGSMNGEYKVISVDGKKYPSHRLAWLYTYGSFPTKHLDHINNHRGDNRIVNLRECNAAQNAQNRLIPKHNTSGYMGVSKANNKWKTVLHKKTLGYFDTPQLAHEAYCEAAKEANKEFFNSGIRGCTTIQIPSKYVNCGEVTITKYHRS